MSETFKVGEIAIMCNGVYHPEYDGMECEIIEPLRLIECLQDGTLALRYKIKAVDGSIFGVVPSRLRKKRPPESDDAVHRQAMLDCIERAKMGQGATA